MLDLLDKLFGNLGKQVVHTDVKQKGSHDQFLKTPIFQTAKFALLAVIGSKSKTLVSIELYDHSNHVFIQMKSQQLTGKATVPDSILCHCLIDKKSLMFSVYRIFFL